MTTTALTELFSLDGRVAVVTGGANGIGRAITGRLAEAGASVMVFDRDAAAAQSAARDIEADTGRRALAESGDVAVAADLTRAAQRAVAELGRLDIWVNNAGIFPPLDALVTDSDQINAVLGVNVVGVQFGMAAAVVAMRAQDRPGVIINVCSTAGFRGAGPYSASKWAVRGMTQGLAAEVGPFGIRVVAVAPTVTETPGMARWRADIDDSHVSVSVDDVVAAVPMRRQGTPDDVACAAVFLASDAASYITGAVLPVDGGSLVTF
jgi:NAD(P)-dependent dehydrogenase (short-subunit alcohol dehydrogenase family)